MSTYVKLCDLNMHQQGLLRMSELEELLDFPMMLQLKKKENGTPDTYGCIDVSLHGGAFWITPSLRGIELCVGPSIYNRDELMKTPWRYSTSDKSGVIFNKQRENSPPLSLVIEYRK